MDSGGTVDVNNFLENKFVLLSEGKYLYILFEAFRREAKLSFQFTKYYHFSHMYYYHFTLYTLKCFKT